jgi:hypothetical protein
MLVKGALEILVTIGIILIFFYSSTKLHSDRYESGLQHYNRKASLAQDQCSH